jgi:hypothetical protein
VLVDHLMNADSKVVVRSEGKHAAYSNVAGGL